MDRKETETVLKSLFEFYHGNPPLEVVSQDLEVSWEDAQALVEDYRRRNTPVYPKEEKKIVVRKRVMEKRGEKRDPSLMIIVAMMGLVSLGAIIASFYYVYLRLIEILPSILPLILSSVLVLFAAFAPQIGVFLLLQKPAAVMGRPPREKRRRGGGLWSKIASVGILFLLWAIVLVVNVSSSIAGQYSVWVAATREEILSSQDTTISSTRLEDYRGDKELLTRNLQGLYEEKNSLLQQIALYDTEEKQRENQRAYSNLLYFISVSNKSIAETEKKLLELSGKIEVLLQEAPSVVVQRQNSDILDFYDWLNKATGIPSETLHLYYLIFLAIFVELIAPVGVAVFLFLRNPAQKFKLGI